MASPPVLALAFYSDRGSAFSEVLPDGVGDILGTYMDILEDLISKITSLPEFRHLVFKRLEEPEQSISSSVWVAIAEAEVDESGEVTGLSNFRKHLDLTDIMLGKLDMPEELEDLLEAKDDGSLAIMEKRLNKKVGRFMRLLKVDRELAEVNPEDEYTLMDALQATVEGQEEPETVGLTGVQAEEEEGPLAIHPSDVVLAVLAYVVAVGGESRVSGGPFRAIRYAVSVVRYRICRLSYRVGGVFKSVWRLEDIVRNNGPDVVKFARRAIGPVLAAIILQKAVAVIRASNSLEEQLARLPPEKRLDHYYTKVLGSDWKEQALLDLEAAEKEVQEGLVTDEVAHEKRKAAAKIYRDLEVKEWDKERMKNYYYGQHGLGMYFSDMYDQLSNPYFVSSRAWNDHPGAWVNENRVFNDYPDQAAKLIKTAEEAAGRKLSQEEILRVVGPELFTAPQKLEQERRDWYANARKMMQ